MVKEVMTVNGPVKAEDLGRTLTHEHVSLTFDKFYVPPPKQLASHFNDKIKLENVGYIKQYPYSSKYNLEFNGCEVSAAIMDEMHEFKKSGGGTILDNTTFGLQRNSILMRDIMIKTGVNVVQGAGFYVSGVQTPYVLSKSVEMMYDEMKTELLEGLLDQPDIRCGFIGEQASQWPIHDFEKHAIQAAALVQSELDYAVSFHPARDPQAPFEIMRIFLEAGGKANRAVMSHLDRTVETDKQLLEFASLGSYCQFDLFGMECSYYQLKESFDMRSDAQRIDQIKVLIADGKEDKILVSHDIHTKHRLVKYGGHGFSHLLNNVMPKMLIKGISQNIVDKIFIKNPATMLCGD